MFCPVPSSPDLSSSVLSSRFYTSSLVPVFHILSWHDFSLLPCTSCPVFILQSYSPLLLTSTFSNMSCLILSRFSRSCSSLSSLLLSPHVRQSSSIMIHPGLSPLSCLLLPWLLLPVLFSCLLLIRIIYFFLMTWLILYIIILFSPALILRSWLLLITSPHRCYPVHPRLSSLSSALWSHVLSCPFYMLLGLYRPVLCMHANVLVSINQWASKPTSLYDLFNSKATLISQRRFTLILFYFCSIGSLICLLFYRSISTFSYAILSFLKQP